jgi:putative nucleotidyltransferase with HDIG domain
MPSRKEALDLLYEFTKSESLRKHALAVEAAMRAYARRFGGDGEEWGIVGLLHDFDYERWPEPKDHPERGAEILKERGYPDQVIRAIKSHAQYLGLERQTQMEKALFAVDELTGLIVAAALVRPSKSLHDLQVSSVKKRMKEKSFAAAVSREDIIRGAEALGVPLDEHITTVIEAMRGIAGELGLGG